MAVKLFQQCLTKVAGINKAASKVEAVAGEFFCSRLLHSKARIQDSAANPPLVEIAISIARENASVLWLVEIRDIKSFLRKPLLEEDNKGTARRDSKRA